MLIRPLDPVIDRAAVETLYHDARDYWALIYTQINTAQLAAGYFTDTPPGCDPGESQRLGVFVDDRLAGIAELSFGFPSPGDAYLGLMIFASWARRQGLGTTLLHEVESHARAKGYSQIFLGVLDSNPKGRAFWLRAGFTDTGFSRSTDEDGVPYTIRRLSKPL